MKVNLKPLLISVTSSWLVSIYYQLNYLSAKKKQKYYYDKFLNELQKGNISKVQIQGDKLEGVFPNGKESFVYLTLLMKV